MIALTRIQQRAFDKDSREDLVVSAVCPGQFNADNSKINTKKMSFVSFRFLEKKRYVATDLNNHKGKLTTDQGIKLFFFK